MNQPAENTEIRIADSLAEFDPAIELLAVEQADGGGLRVVIDHPDGVTLGLCARVTEGLGDIRQEHAIEVASPGPKRPLVKPEHFMRYRGSRIRLSTREPIEGRSNYTGSIEAADREQVNLECDGTLYRIAYNDIGRAHLMPVTPEGAGK